MHELVSAVVNGRDKRCVRCVVCLHDVDPETAERNAAWAREIFSERRPPAPGCFTYEESVIGFLMDLGGFLSERWDPSTHIDGYPVLCDEQLAEIKRGLDARAQEGASHR